MKKVLLAMVAFLGLPLVWVLIKCFLEALAIETLNAPFFTQGRICFLSGFGAMTLLYVWKGAALQVVYVFAHEMTHAVAGLLCFAKVHQVSVRTTGGFVQLSKSNLFITLAPYCLPFYLLIAVLVYGIVHHYWPNAIPFAVWATLFGFFTAFHVWYTANALFAVSQPDTHEYGRFFSWWFILVMNLFFALLALVITSSHVTLREQAKRLGATSVTVYCNLYERAKAVLPHDIVNSTAERMKK